jgi:hypothetical protein
MTSNQSQIIQSAEEKLQQVWQFLAEQSSKNTSCPKDTKWPSYNDVLNDVRNSDYNEILTCPLDVVSGSKDSKKKGRQKTICPLGVVCCAKLELFNVPQENSSSVKPYTGLLTPGTTIDHCMLRLSSALQPVDTTNRMAKIVFGTKLAAAKIFPGVALKVFRSGSETSGNALFLGCKVGQTEDDFFAHCVCTQMTERMPRTLKPFVKPFWKYSDYPLSLGMSDFCKVNAEGIPATIKEHNFPYALVLSPYSTSHEKSAATTTTTTATHSNSFLDDMLAVPAGTVLYDVFASPDPLSVADGRKLQRIGRIVTTSEMIQSPPDDGLFFRHQKKDEDYLLRPHWKHDLATKVILKDGTKGTVANLAGWELFENQIEAGGFVDFEPSQ